MLCLLGVMMCCVVDVMFAGCYDVLCGCVLCLLGVVMCCVVNVMFAGCYDVLCG